MTIEEFNKETGESFQTFDEIDWNEISKYAKLSEKTIREFSDKLNWFQLSIYQTLTEELIRDFQDKVDWECISEYQKLSEDFIREFKDVINWGYISVCQYLSEDFIREFKDKVDWDAIEKYQGFTEWYLTKLKSSLHITNPDKVEEEMEKEHSACEQEVAFPEEAGNHRWHEPSFLYEPVDIKRKYTLTEETIVKDGVTLHRIECVEPFGFVAKGDKGGFIESECNLSQTGVCWVDGDACVYGGSRVEGDAIVEHHATVCENSLVSDEAVVCENAVVKGNSTVKKRAAIRGKAIVSNSDITDYVCITGNALIDDNSYICGGCVISEDVTVRKTTVACDVRLCGNAVINSREDFIPFKNTWSSGRTFVWTRSNNMWTAGCFHGTGEELIEKAYKDSELKGKCYEEYVRLVERLSEIQKQQKQTKNDKL